MNPFGLWAGSGALALAMSLPVLANGLDDFLAFNAATKTATARFDQQVFDRAGKVVERASGTFAFARPASSAGPTRSRTSRCWWATARSSGSTIRT